MSPCSERRFLKTRSNVMLDILLPSLLLLAIGVALHSFVKQASEGGRLKSDLPVHRRSLSSTSARWKFERNGFSASLSTTGLNAVAIGLIDDRRTSFKRSVLGFYNIGIYAGTLGGLAALGATMWQLLQVWAAVWLEARSHAAQKSEVVSMVKRLVTERDVQGMGSAPQLDGLQPLIPGVTLPLRHLPTLLLALIVNQLIHELGHALSAALGDIPLSSFSLNFHLFLPSMAVHLPATIDYLPARAKMRLASSGPFHNLLTYGWLWLLAFSGMSALLWVDMSDIGRVVHTVSDSSPLAPHIVPGRVITHLDDVSIAGHVDTWSDYLNGEALGDSDRGWCIDSTLYTAMPDSPCAPISGHVAFETVLTSSKSTTKCMAPYPVLYTPSVRPPCANSDDVMIRPLESERILRIRLYDGTHTGEVVFWQGDRSAVMRDIKIGREGARFLGPVVRWGTIYIEYLKTVALSLFLFNLLPLPHTDGSQLLRALLSLSPNSNTFSLRSSRSHPLTRSRSRSRPSARTSPVINIRYTSAQEYELPSDDEDGYDIEDHRRTGSREGVWRKSVRRVVEGVSVVMAIGWVAGWAMLALLRSS